MLLFRLSAHPYVNEQLRSDRTTSRSFSGYLSLTVRLQNFADIDLVSKEKGKKFDFVLADLGVSSMQIDNPERGFSYKVD